MKIGISSVAFVLGWAAFAQIATAQEVSLNTELSTISKLADDVAFSESNQNAIDFRFEVKPIAETIISSEKDGKVIRVFKKEGDTFKAGETLVEFDCVEESLNLARSNALLNGYTKKLSAKKQLKAHKAISKIELIDAEMEYDTALADLKYWKRSVKKCFISAPFEGKVVSLYAKEHEYVSVGAPLIELIDDSEFYVIVNAPSNWLGAKAVGKEFAAKVIELKANHFVQFDRLGPKIDAISQTVRMYGSIKNISGKLKAGMSGYLKEVTYQEEKNS